MLRFMRALFRRDRRRAPQLEGEEYEIFVAEQQRKEQHRRFVESVAEKMSHLSFPFKRDPFD